MAMNEHKLFIDGQWRESPNVKDIRSPYDQAVIGRVHFATQDQVREALDAAKKAFGRTRRLSSGERAAV
ncbi:MAG: aldehyde dehydrogenase family protein, partial [Candidatus Aminicenantes bacterium]|nr:aldehyde dehydrogenase family protein [Candidatus Aminicenantes bacterium]